MILTIKSQLFKFLLNYSAPPIPKSKWINATLNLSFSLMKKNSNYAEDLIKLFFLKPLFN